MVQSSRAIDKELGSNNDHLPPLTMAVTIYFENLEQIRTHLPYFYFAFSVLWSSPVEQLIKSEVLITTTYHLLQWLSQYTLRVFGKISFSFSAKPKIIQ